MQLGERIAGRSHQQREVLENLVEQGLLRLERAGAALGMMNAQPSVLGARGDQGANVARFSPDINAEIEEIDAIFHMNVAIVKNPFQLEVKKTRTTSKFNTPRRKQRG